MENKNRLGWVRVCGDNLSQFHRQLIQTFPKYASAAVSECMLPGSPDVLPYEERVCLRSSTPALTTLLRYAEKITDMGPAVAPPLLNTLVGENQKELCGSGEPITWYTKTERKLYLRHKGKKGQTVAIYDNPSCLFRGKSVSVTDSLGGNGTLIAYQFVGGRNQYSKIFPCLTKEAGDRLRRDVKPIDSCQTDVPCGFLVRFEEDCEFSAVITGEVFASDVRSRCLICVNSRCECVLNEKEVVVVDSCGNVIGKEVIATGKPVQLKQWTFMNVIEGRAGERKPLNIRPHLNFRATRIRVDDSVYGRATRVGDIFVNGVWQSLASAAALGRRTVEANARLNYTAGVNEYLLSACSAGGAISIMVEFEMDCRFMCILEGKVLG